MTKPGDSAFFSFHWTIKVWFPTSGVRNGSGAFSSERKESPVMFFVSHYNLYEVAAATLVVVVRLREQFAG
ncbi:hypothetical protein KKD52_05820, partial [Myxococcota bacterium]|nr:hypothetical protein [Myxococcota bacterium]MBU1509859.1 hypothetical protein [Myxococcota bacterium]